MFTTIDIDRNLIKERVEVMSYILSCSSIRQIYMERSTSGRGWHITINCNKKYCLKCRRKFDDPIRFNADINHREQYQRDVLFESKEMHYPEAGIIRIFEKGKKPVIKTINTIDNQ